MKNKQLRKAKKLITNARLTGIFGPDSNKIFYLMFTCEIRNAHKIINKYGRWLIRNDYQLFQELTEIAAINAPNWDYEETELPF